MNFSTDTTSGAEGRELFYRIRAAHSDLPVIAIGPFPPPPRHQEA